MREANKILAATTDCNSLYCALDPREGGTHRGRGSGAQSHLLRRAPLAVTDNLNFGNPYKPENFWQLREAVEGMAEAAALSARRSSAATSLYIMRARPGVVDPTPTVGDGRLDRRGRRMSRRSFSRTPGDVIHLWLGETRQRTWAHRDFLKVCHGRKEGPAAAARSRTRNGRAMRPFGN